MKIAVLCKDGFEELEALGIVDMARRVNVKCDIVGFSDSVVRGSHGINIEADIDFAAVKMDYDAIVIPGGMPGARRLQEDNAVVELVKKYHENKKLVGAICAGPIVLAKAGILAGKTVTCYPGFEKELTGANYQESLVMVDGNIVTAKGPSATFAFAFAMLNKLGIDTGKLEDGVQYTYLKSNI